MMHEEKMVIDHDPSQPPMEIPMSTQIVIYDNDNDNEEDLLMENISTRRGLCCSFLACFGSRPYSTRTRLSSSLGSTTYAWEKLQETTDIMAERRRAWWDIRALKGLRKIREWSEIIAGPKWKTFIRRFNRNGKFCHRRISSSGKFQYDPLSYSLNFDDNSQGHNDIGDVDFPDFSSRFASPNSCKSSMDLGRNGISP